MYQDPILARLGHVKHLRKVILLSQIKLDSTLATKKTADTIVKKNRQSKPESEIPLLQITGMLRAK